MIKEDNLELSIVTTIYNNEESIQLFVEQIIAHLHQMKISYEIILVNDFSVDKSSEQIELLCSKNNQIKGIELARNYGQQIAISVGMRYASGDYVLIIDGDNENPLSAISQLYLKIKEGYDIVYAITKSRQSLMKKITSSLFWFVVCRLLKIRVVKNQLLMRIMTKRMIDSYNNYGELTRSVAGITNDIGLKSAEINVQLQKRTHGASNYSFFKRLNLFIDVVLNLSVNPMNFIIFLGVGTFFISVLVSIYYLFLFFTQNVVPGYTSTILAIFLFGSIIVFILGIISRYLSLIYLEVRNRPLFHIQKTFNVNKDQEIN